MNLLLGLLWTHHRRSWGILWALHHLAVSAVRMPNKIPCPVEWCGLFLLLHISTCNPTSALQLHSITAFISLLNIWVKMLRPLQYHNHWETETSFFRQSKLIFLPVSIYFRPIGYCARSSIIIYFLPTLNPLRYLQIKALSLFTFQYAKQP